MKHPPCSRLWAAVSTDVGDRAADSASRPLAARAWLVNATNVPVPPLRPTASFSPSAAAPPVAPWLSPAAAAAAVARRRECCQSTANRNASSSCPKKRLGIIISRRGPGGLKWEHVVEPLEARARR
ncbi:unnamed protein product [Ectocarpus sp. 6 AP-2014]